MEKTVHTREEVWELKAIGLGIEVLPAPDLSLAVAKGRKPLS